MFNASIARNAFPALLTEDDVDSGSVGAAAAPFPLILPASRRFTTTAPCARPAPPDVRDPTALLTTPRRPSFSSRGAIERSPRVAREADKYDKFRHFDMKLFASHHPGVHIACPPVLHWVTSFQTSSTNARRPGLTWCHPRALVRPSSPGHLHPPGRRRREQWARPRTHLLERSRAVRGRLELQVFARKQQRVGGAAAVLAKGALAALQVLEETSCAGRFGWTATRRSSPRARHATSWRSTRPTTCRRWTTDICGRRAYGRRTRSRPAASLCRRRRERLLPP